MKQPSVRPYQTAKSWMIPKHNNANVLVTAFGCLLLTVISVCFVFTVLYVLGACWEYSINTWLEIAKSPNRVELWQCMLISCVPAFGQISFFVAIFTWIAALFLK